MAKFSARLVILAAFVLIVGAMQCATACTPVSNEQPACHHHKQAPANHCPQEMVAAGVSQGSFAAVPLFCSAVGAMSQREIAVMDVMQMAADPSPPSLHPPVPLILRV